MADWIEYDTQFVRRRYNKLAPIYVAFEYVFLLPPGIRGRAVRTLDLKTGDRVLDLRQLAREIEVQYLFMDTYFIGRAAKPIVVA